MFPDRIKELIAQRGISQKDFLTTLGLGTNSFANWERKTNDPLGNLPTCKNLLRIAKFFNVSVDYLLELDSDDEIKQTISQSIGDNSPNNIQFVGSKNSITPNGEMENIILHEILKLTDEQKQRLLLRIDNKNFKANNSTKGGFTIVEDFNKGVLYNFEVNKECPLCGSAIIPNIITSKEIDFNGYKTQNKRQRIAIFSCPACGRIFTVLYENPTIGTNGLMPSSEVVSYKSISPLLSCDTVYSPFSPKIKEAPPEFNISDSPDAFSKFKEAYKDIQLVKAYDIKGVIGMAIRRCIDYLVHDYIEYKGLDAVNISEDEFRNLNLSSLIERVINDEQTQEFAKKITWLANDFTHYFDKHPDYSEKDVENLFEYLLIDIKGLIAKNEVLKHVERA